MSHPKRPLTPLTLLTPFTLLTLLTLPLWHKAHHEANRAIQEGKTLEATGDLRASVSAYQRAMRAYSPGAHAPAEGAASLARLAAQAESAGDEEGARWALDHLRGGAWATRWLLDPFAQEAALADAALTRLRAKQAAREERQRGEPPQPLSAHEALQGALLRDDPRPHPLASLALTLSGACWLGALIGLMRDGVTPEGRLNERAPRWLWAASAGGAGALIALALC